MTFNVIIPARFASTRLPGKPLLDIAGQPMIRHVWERARRSSAARVVIATDDERILATARGFGAEDFARSHPGGTLGRRLLTHVRDIMREIDTVPCVGENASIAEAVLAISRGGMGMTAVATERRAVVGIFTDGDLRRTLGSIVDFKGTPVTQVMTRNPHTIGPERLAAETAQMMEEYKISQILVVENDMLIGALNTHDLFRAKVI